MRITGGRARGIPLILPTGDAVRPATDAMRQAVFSSLAARVEGAIFADFFAGSGAYGLEALSRGAAGGRFIEKNAKVVSCLRRNIMAVCKSLGRSEADLAVLNLDASSAAAMHGEPADLVFIDPPYDIIKEVGPKLFAQLTQWLERKPDPVVVFEMSGEMELSPSGWTCVKRLGKGTRQPCACLFRPNRALT